MSILARILRPFSTVRGTHKSPRRVRLCLEPLEERTVPTLLGQTLFPADNAWNQKVATAPVASNSAAIINNILSHYGDGRLHPDFGQNYRAGNPLYGIPYNIVHGNSMSKSSVAIDAYANESNVIPAPIPANAVLEGDFDNRPNPTQGYGSGGRGDSHLLIYDVDNNVAYEFYYASRPSENADGKWHADQESVWDMKTNTFRTIGWTSADAAGLSLLAGLVRPDEGLPTSQGGQGVINHAIRFTLQNSIILNQFLYPAEHVANPGNTNAAVQPPMGARFRLKAGVDLSTLNPQSRVIAQAMKDYGMIVADNGSNFFFTGASYAVDASNQQVLTWNDNDVQDSLHGLKSLHFSDFEVLDLTPVVTDLSVHSGAAGSVVTVIGQSFSGAAGRLQVLFGGAPATSVTIVDDGHLTAVVPAGSGTVDVRVQSGITTGSNSQNYKSPVFGYGVSTVTTGDRFTYGTSTNQPPTIATPAAATPNPVTGQTTTVSALGADDGGEANLVYTWTSSGPSAVSFSVNDSNAAKNAVAGFSQSGNYVLTVTVADSSGLSVTSSVTVSVTIANQAPTVATPAKGTPSPVLGKTTTLSVLGADDGGEANLRYTWASTGPAAVQFSANGTNAAKNVTATFSKAGVYSFVVTITDAAGLAISSSVNVTVQQTLTSIVVSPGTATVSAGRTLAFLARALDQFGDNLAQQPVFTWSVTGRGTISKSGVYSAPRRAGGPFTITASAGGIKGIATVTVV